MTRLNPVRLLFSSLIFAGAFAAHAQSAADQPAQVPAPPQPAAAAQPAQPPDTSQPPEPPDSPTPAPPAGKVLFSRDHDTQLAAPSQTTPEPHLGPGDPDPLKLTDLERTGLTFTAYDLDVHLTPANHGIRVRAAISLHGPPALGRVVLQISSSLHWDSFSIADASGVSTPLPFTARLVDTDADHTGAVSEAVITLPRPMGQSTLSLVALYSGAIPQSTERLTRIGAPAVQAYASDWDAIDRTHPETALVGTALRGFGNVIWVPVSAPPVFLGDGAKLFQLVGSLKQRSAAASIRLRLSVEYTGEPPDAAYFCGRREPLLAISDNLGLPAAEAPGIATAIFDAEPLGFRTPSLFITARPASLIGPPGHADLIAAVTARDTALRAYTAAAAQVTPLLTDWLGPQPLTQLTLLDHPGNPYEDDALLVGSLAAADPNAKADGKDPADLAPALVHSLTHAWIRSSHPWIDEGLPEFLSMLWTERTQGRAAALAELAELDRPIALAEPNSPVDNPAPSGIANSSVAASPAISAGPQSNSHPGNTSLADATDEVFYRNKAAAVWWMLRTIAGDDALKQALQAYRNDPRLDRESAGSLQRALESAAHMDLAWFFRDWINADRGLPDLTIANVTPSPLEPNGAAAAGWLVAVSVHNDGDAEAEVPVIVRGGGATETRLLRVPGHATASVRVVFAGTPDQVQVNDGSVPETESSLHTRALVLPTKR